MDQITLTPAQTATLLALERRRLELQAEHAEITAAMHALGKHYAIQAGLDGEGKHTLTLSAHGQSTVKFTPKQQEQELPHEEK